MQEADRKAGGFSSNSGLRFQDPKNFKSLRLIKCFLKVHWVQCDKCELWYHLFCIGLKPHDIKEDEDFVCKNCKVDRSEGSSKRRQNDTSASDMDTE